MTLNLIRQLEVFDPALYADKRIDVVGAGAVGSYIVWYLAKIGMENIHVWDFDIVEDHNLANQCFLKEHVGKPKVEAIADMVKKGAGIDIVQHNEAVDGTQKLGNIVFLAVDKMSIRKMIWQKSLKMKIHVKAMIETRMSYDSGRIYVVEPLNLTHVKEWEETLCEDDQAEVSSCGAILSIATTASDTAVKAVEQMMKVLKQEKVENEYLFWTSPQHYESRYF